MMTKIWFLKYEKNENLTPSWSILGEDLLNLSITILFRESCYIHHQFFICQHTIIIIILFGYPIKCINLRILLFLLQSVTWLTFNMDKCELIGINLNNFQCHQIQNNLNMQWTSFPTKYIILPLLNKGINCKGWQCVIHKFERKLHGWKDKMLPFGGKWILFKSALQRMPLFFLYP